jgi:hypothetical protein
MDRTFTFRYSPRLRWLFVLLGMGPKRSSVVLTDDALRVRMGAWFEVDVPRASIRAAGRYRDVWWAIGVHTDLRGSWLANGSASGIVFCAVDPPASGMSVFVFGATVRQLGLGLDDPEGFLAALGLPPAAPSS